MRGPGIVDRPGRRWGVWLTAALLLGAAVALARWRLTTGMGAAELLHWLRERAGERALVPAFAGAYLVLTSALTPAALLHAVGGAAFGFWKGLGLNLLLFNIAASVQFVLARRLGRRHVAAWLTRLRVAGWDERLEKEGLWAALLIRIVPLPAAAVAATCGLSALRWRDFAVGTAVATLPLIASATWVAAAIAEGLAAPSLAEGWKPLVGALLLMAAVLATRRALRRKARRLETLSTSAGGER